jgi:sulfotransferase family protein
VSPPHPLFVGGTGRSGTHAAAKLLGRHSQYHYVSRELRFHTDRGGLPDLLSGRIDVDHFLRNMREYYWRREGADGRDRGLYSKFKRKHFEAALTELQLRFPEDPEAAAAGLVSALLDPMAAEEGKPSWIEQTPQTAAAAGTLHAMFPGMKLVHMIRDGRDVASSVAGMWWGPNSMRGALRWWERRLRAAQEGLSALPADRVLTLSLEDLVVRDREGSYRHLLEFLEIEDERRMRRHFDKQLTAEKANVGRWRQSTAAWRQRRIDRAYAGAVERLRRDGVDCVPEPEAEGP